jgi:hypothetical protein
VDASRSARDTLDVEPAAQEADPLAHPDEAQAPGLRRGDELRLDVEPFPVVGDLGLEVATSPRDAHLSVAPSAVFVDVVERLLDLPKERDFLRRR